MKGGYSYMCVKFINRMLLGLLMLVPGLMKLWAYIQTPDTWFVPGMLSSLHLPAPGVIAWILVAAEILSGLAILANFKLQYAIWPPVVILLIAAFTMNLSNPSGLLLHLAAVSNLLLIGWYCNGDDCCIHPMKSGSASHKKK
jgi:uncharacterized membrane protein YphA (DoxX/SURF4 family)